MAEKQATKSQDNAYSEARVFGSHEPIEELPRHIPWWMLVAGVIVAFTAVASVAGFIAVGRAYPVERYIFLSSMVFLVAGVAVLAWAVHRQSLIDDLHTTGVNGLAQLRPSERTAYTPYPRAASRSRFRGGPRRSVGELWKPADSQSDDLAAGDDPSCDKTRAGDPESARQAIQMAREISSRLARLGALEEADDLDQRARAAFDISGLNEGTSDAPVRNVQKPAPLAVMKRTTRTLRRTLAPAAAVIAIAFGQAIGGTAVSISATSLHLVKPTEVRIVGRSHDATQDAGETCTQAVTEVASFAATHPRLARQYAHDANGLPMLVAAAVRRRCGGDFRRLLR